MIKVVPLDLSRSTKFKQDYKKAVMQRRNLDILTTVVDALRHRKPIATKFRDHALSNNWVNHRELHLTPDWLLIYTIDKVNNTLTLVRLGSHAEIFKM